jgi:hypothetical protein
MMTNAQKLASLPAAEQIAPRRCVSLNVKSESGDVLIYVSDNESWIDTPIHGRFGGSGTETMKQWNEFKSRNADAKLVCIDIQPYAHTQAKERADILNVGGFSDQVFTLISEFAGGTLDAEHWVGVIEKVDVENQQWLTVSNSEFGTTFFTSERIEKTPNFIVLEHKRNWNPEKYFHALLLISISIKNILVCLNNMNGNQNNSNYLFPNDENFYETPWKFDDSAHLSVRPRIANKNLPILTKEGISSAYKKDVDLN